jgi:anti-sigma B factor antagonist
MERSMFIYKWLESRIVIIELPKTVVGGEDAMQFTELIDNLALQNARSIVIDLENLDLINSTGLGMLAGTHTNLTKKEIPLFLINLPDKIKKLLTMTHLDQVMKIRNNINDVVTEIS